MLAWNFIEDIVDQCVSTALRARPEETYAITSRINGLDGKFALIKLFAARYLILEPAEIKMVEDAINQVAQFKRYRDGVIHARLLAPNSDVALTNWRQGAVDEVLLSLPALETLYDHLDVLSHEIVAVYRLLEGFYYDEWDLIPEGSFDPNEIRISARFRDAILLIRDSQSRRQFLPPLPKFPEAPEAHQASGAN